MEKSKKRILAFLMAIVLIATLIIPDGFGLASDNTGVDITSLASPNDAGLKLAAPNLADYLKSVDIGTLDQSGQSYTTVTGTTYVGNGDSIQVSLIYTIPANTLSAGSSTVTYTLPTTVKVTSEQKGDVTDSNGNVVGTYTISTDGTVTIVFEEGTYLKFDEDFTGYLIFNCQANQTDNSSSSAITFNATSGDITTSVTVVAGSEDCDISTAKGVTTYTEDLDGSYTATYTITVSTTLGTRGTVDVSDALTGMSGTSIDANTITVTNSSGMTVSGYTLTSDETSFSITGLSQLSTGEYYTITYNATLTAEAYKTLNGSNYISNKASATSTDTGKYKTDTSTVTKTSTITHSMLTKAGSSTSGNTVTWTVVVNAAHDDLDGYTLSDVLGNSLTSSDISNFTVTATDSKGNVVSGANITQDAFFGSGYTFSGTDTNTYTITYSYTTTETVRTSNITIDNDATLTNNAYTYEAEGNGIFYTTSHLGKAYSSATNEGSDDATYTWTLTLKGADDTIPSGSTVTDTLGDYLTITQSDASSFTASAAITATIELYGANAASIGTITFNNSTTGTLTWTGASDAVAKSFVITLNSAISSNITITYATTPSYDGMSVGDIRTFKNTAYITINGTSESPLEKTQSYTKKDVIEKYIYASTDTWGSKGWTTAPMDTTYGDEVYPSAWSSGYAGYYDLTAYQGDGVYYYYILVNADGSLNNTSTDVEITDTITNGTYVSGSAALLNNVSDYAVSSYSLGTSVNGGTLTFTIPASAFTTSGTSAKQYYIIYAVQCDTSTSTLELSNTASISGGNDAEITVDVEPGTNTGSTDVLKKSGVQGEDSYGNPTSGVTYTVEVNPDAEDLLTGYDTLTLKDTMSVPVNGLLSVTLSSINVYTMDSNGDKDEELNGGWSYTFDKDTTDSSTWYYYLTINVPDETALIVEYEYTYTYDSSSSGTSRDISNAVSIEGTQYSVSEDESYTVASSLAGVNNGSTATVYKVDSSDNSIYLSGATFTFEYYDTSTPGWVSVSGYETITINESVQFTSGNLAGAIPVNTGLLYRLTEKSAPTGYTNDGAVLYMVFGANGETLSTLKSSFSSLLSTLGIDADLVSYYVYGYSGYQEQISNTAEGTIYITKNWQDSNGNTLTNTSNLSDVTVTLNKTDMSTKKSSTVTVNTSGAIGTSSTTYDVENGTSMTITFSYSNGTSVYTTVNPNVLNNGVDVTSSLVKVNDAHYTYTFDVNDNTTVAFSDSGYWTSDFTVSATYTAGYYETSGSASAVSVSKTSSGVYEATANGTDTITLSNSNNWTAMVTGLDINNLYSVVENLTLSGYTVSYSGSVALSEATDITSKVTSGSIVVTNKKNPATTGDLIIKKTVDGDITSLSEVKDSISIIIINSSGTTVATVTGDDLVSGNGSVTISDLDAGTYKVTETLTDVNGYTVTTTYTVGTTSGSGTATGSFAVTSGSTTNVEITNTYTSTAATIKINKTYSSGSTVKGVSFGIYNSATPSQTSLVDTVTIAASEFSSNSAEATYTIADATAGTTYYVYELDVNGSPITSTATVFKLDSTGTYYTVSSSDNTNISLSAGGAAAATFTNTEIADTSVSLNASKTLNGGTISANQFTFILSYDGTSTAQSKMNLADGTVTFNDISYTAADIGTHTYYIYERDDSASNTTYTYDGSCYKVMVAVALNTAGDGLTASVAIRKYDSVSAAVSDTNNTLGASVNAIAFENTYYGNGSITVTKSFSGTVNDVTFALYSGGSFVESKTLSASDYNSGTYTVTFDNLDTRNTYTVYEYASSTTYGDGGTITIGSSTYTIDASGNTNIDLSASNTATCTFTNTETTTLVIDKSLAGRGASTSDTFTFSVTLSDTNIDGTYGDMTFNAGVATVTITGDGEAQATGLPAGITYTVAETNSGGYTSVCTSGNESGTLEAGKPTTVAYTNTKTSGSLQISKTVSGETNSTQSFEFTITIPDLADETVSATRTTTSNPTGTPEDVTFGNTGVTTVTLKDGESLIFTGLEAGTSYTVSEKDYTGSGYLTTVSGSESGTIKDGETATVAYTNTKVSTATLTVTKKLDGNDYSAYTDQEFTVYIYLTPGTTSYTLGYLAGTYSATRTSASGSTPEYVGFTEGTSNAYATVTLKGGESLTISGIPEGTVYTVAEADYTTLGFDSPTFTYTDNTSGTISSSEVSSVTITNTRNTTGDLILSKKVDGNSASQTKEFVFTITLDDNSINDTYAVTSTGGNANTTISSVAFVSGIATVSLIKDQTITIAGLPNGVGYTVKETDYTSDGYVTTVVDNSGATLPSNEATGNITGGSQDKVEFTNTCDTYGKLVISKVISGNDTDSNKEFAFTVTLTGSSVDGTYAVTSTGGNTSTTISSVTFTGGTATVYLIGGQTITIDGLPNGVTYTVVEDDYSSIDGYVTTVSSSTGAVDNNERKVTGTISSGTTETATYTNTKDTYGNLTITKTVEKNGSTVLTSDSDTFTFTITLSGTNDTNILTHDYTATSTDNIYTVVSFSNGTATVKLKSGQSVTITGIPNGVGYTVTEKTVDGYTVSTSNGVTGSTYTAGSSVSDTVDGKVGTNSQYYALFKNTLITQSLSISKVLDGNNTDADDYFAFDITLTDKNDNPISDTYDNVVFTSGTATIYLKGGETKTITGLPEGTKYTVTEKSGVYDANGVEDTTADNYTLSGVSGNGTVTASSASGTITSAEGATAVFTNTRNAYGSLTVSKSVSSGDTTKKFSFTITLSNTTDDSVLNGSFAATSVGASYDTILFSAGKATIELADGESVTMTGLPKGVNYTVTEDDYSSDGYVTTSVGSVGVISADTVNTAAFTNKLTSVSISKVDIADGEELVGATIQIIDSQGNIVEEWVSGTDPHVITGLIPGETYILRETVAPTGYDIATDTIFVLDEYGNIDTTKTTTSISDTGVLLVEDSLTAVSTTTETLTTETSTTETSTTETSTTETSTTETSTDTTTTTTTNTDTPDSGDHAPIVPIAILLLCSTGAATVLFIKKRRMNKA